MAGLYSLFILFRHTFYCPHLLLLMLPIVSAVLFGGGFVVGFGSDVTVYQVTPSFSHSSVINSVATPASQAMAIDG